MRSPSCCSTTRGVLCASQRAAPTPQQPLTHTRARVVQAVLGSGAAAQLLRQSEVQESDLIPGKYEGGFKLWEGALDLARFLVAGGTTQEQGQQQGASGSGAQPPGSSARQSSVSVQVWFGLLLCIFDEASFWQAGRARAQLLRNTHTHTRSFLPAPPPPHRLMTAHARTRTQKKTTHRARTCSSSAAATACRASRACASARARCTFR